MEFNSLLKLLGDESIFESSILLAGNVDPKEIRIQLSRWVKSGKIQQLRRGVYTIAPPYQKFQPHPFLIANHLQKASYVSLQSALSFHGLIPELVNITSSVSTGRPERLETALGVYEFRHIKTELFFGYHMTDLGRQSAFVATPEKALLDLLYLQPGSYSVAYLQALRLQNTEKLEKDILSKQAERTNSPKLINAVKGILQFLSDGSESFENL
jgi:predicted transcriptional regulator of viral defense system